MDVGLDWLETLSKDPLAKGSGSVFQFLPAFVAIVLSRA